MADRAFHGTRPAVCLYGILICAVSLVSACTVRESRADCPCSLRLLLDGVGPSFLRVRDTEGVLMEQSLSGDLEEWELELPRTRVFIELTEGGVLPLEIPPGEGSPPLRCFRDTLDLTPGETVVPVRPLRQYAELTVEGNPDAGLLITGTVSGFARDASPVAGPFSCSGNLRDGPARFLLPRQRNASLRLCVTLGTASSEFALGEILAAEGYDWAAPDLPPCTLRLDLAATLVRTDADPWKGWNYWQVIL